LYRGVVDNERFEHLSDIMQL